MIPGTLIRLVLAFSDRLRYRKLFLSVFALLIINLLIPDFIPFLDEILLGFLAAFLASFKKKKLENKRPSEGVVIEGEIVEEDEK